MYIYYFKMQALFLLLLCAFNLLNTEAVVSKIKLRKIESRRSRLMRSGDWKQYLEQKRQLQAQLRNSTLKSVTHQNLRDYDDLEYVGDITIGQQQQKFSVLLDTGSACLWVPGIECTTASCKSKNKFDSASSNTFQLLTQLLQISYGDGTTASGYYGSETVTFGDDVRLTIRNQAIGVATSLTIQDGNKDVDFDGIVGLGFPDLDTPYHHIPPVLNAWRNGDLDQPVFTVWFPSKASGGIGGQITYGGLDTEHCGDVIAYEKLTSISYWMFSINSFGTEQWATHQTAEAISDTGTSFLYGPMGIIDRIARELGGMYDGDNGVYFVNCSSTEGRIVVEIGSHTYYIESQNYVIEVETNYGKMCLLAIYPNDGGSFGFSYILGDTFIRQYCQIYDMERNRIGFAPSLTSEGGMTASEKRNVAILSVMILAMFFF